MNHPIVELAAMCKVEEELEKNEEKLLAVGGQTWALALRGAGDDGVAVDSACGELLRQSSHESVQTQSLEGVKSERILGHEVFRLWWAEKWERSTE
jgi:hypothetical protein